MSKIIIHEVRHPKQRDKWRALGGVWIINCDECGGYDPDNPTGLGKSMFLTGYPTKAAAARRGKRHVCYPPAVAQHEQVMAELDDEEGWDE